MRLRLGVGSGARIEVEEVSLLRSEMALRELRWWRLKVDGPRGILTRVGVALTTVIAGLCPFCAEARSGFVSDCCACCWDLGSRTDSCSDSITGAGRLREVGSSPRACCGNARNGDERKPKARRRRFGRAGVVTAGMTAIATSELIVVVVSGGEIGAGVAGSGGGVGDAKRDRVICRRKAV